MVVNIGDTFRIDMTEAVKILYPNILRCKFPNKTFVVERFSKSSRSVYYIDNRTSSKCECVLCDMTPQDKFSDRKMKCVSVNFIIITETKLQRERNIKLKQILK